MPEEEGLTEKSNLSGPPKNESELTEIWTNELFGCFSDIKLCIGTFICPCYTMAKNAQHFGEDWMVVGFLTCLGLGNLFGPTLRWRLRQEKKIKGSMFMDAAVHTCLPCCAIIQENKEIYGPGGSHIMGSVPIDINIERK